MRLVPVAYLGSYFLSIAGNSIAAVALPLLVLQATGSALDTGLVAAATAVPAVLFGILGGAVVDRINRRTASVVSDLISAGAIAALPLVDLVTGLTVGWFVLFGVIGALGDVPGMTAREALLPAVVRHSGVSAERMIGSREALGAIGMLIGPVVAALLITLLPGSAVLWVTAATSFAAAVATLAVPRRVGALEAAPDAQRGLRVGLRLLVTDGFLRTTTVVGLLSLVVIAALQGLVLPVHFTLVGETAALGFVLSAIAAGLLVGGATYAVVGSRWPRRVWLLIGLVGSTIGVGVVVLLPGTGILLAGAAVLGASSGALSGVLGVLMLERIPDAVRGRVLGAQNAAMLVAAPVGIMLAAVLTELGGVRVAALVLAAIWVAAVVAALVARSLRNLEPGSVGGEVGDAQR